MTDGPVIGDRVLTIVSGKGGVGKTTVATAIAAEHAARGRATLLVDSSGGDRHRMLDAAIDVKPQPAGDNLYVVRIDARLALKEYLGRRTAFGGMYRRLVDQPAVARFLDALPAFDELMTLGKLYDYCTGALTPFERVVFDAPATGHCMTLLRTPHTAAGTLAGGPVREAALKVRGLITDSARTELVIVTLPEETPVAEAIELHRFARDVASIACAPFVVNRVERTPIGAADVAALERIGGELAGASAAVFRELLALAEAQERHIAALAGIAQVIALDEASEPSAAKRMAAVRRQLPVASP